MFNVAADDLEQGLDNEDGLQVSEGDLAFLETQPTENNAESTPNKTDTLNLDNTLSPIQNEEVDYVIMPNTRNVPHKLRKRVEPTWRDKDMNVRKFVDDNVQIEKTNMQASTTYREGPKVFKNPRLIKSENMFNHIAENVKKRPGG